MLQSSVTSESINFVFNSKTSIPYQNELQKTQICNKNRKIELTMLKSTKLSKYL